MKHEPGIVTCDKCQDPITDNEIKEGVTLHYGKVDYHASCMVKFLREHGAIPPKNSWEQCEEALARTG